MVPTGFTGSGGDLMRWGIGSSCEARTVNALVSAFLDWGGRLGAAGSADSFQRLE